MSTCYIYVFMTMIAHTVYLHCNKKLIKKKQTKTNRQTESYTDRRINIDIYG